MIAVEEIPGNPKVTDIRGFEISRLGASSLGTVPPDQKLTGTVTVKNNRLDPSSDKIIVGFLMPVYDSDNDRYSYLTYSEDITLHGETKSVEFYYGTRISNQTPPSRGYTQDYDVKTYAVDWNIEGLTPPYTYGAVPFVAKYVANLFITHTVDSDERVIGIQRTTETFGGYTYYGYDDLEIYNTAWYPDQFTVQAAAEITDFSMSKE